MAAFNDPLPDRIWICGPTGSGKSTLAVQLAEALGVTATHMDDLHWRPGWTEAPDEELVRDVTEVVARPRWVIDGNYSRVRKRFLADTQLHVWLDFRLSLTFSRVLRRTFARSLRGEPCCNGNRESLRRAFAHRDSILLWSLSHHREQRRINRALLAGQPRLRFTTPQQVRAWRDAVTRGRRAASTRSSPARPPCPPGG